MADDTIKSFLVSLGFKTDEASQKKFTDNIGMAQAKAVALGEAMYDMAKMVAASIAKVATDFDSLYWQTQRLGSSAQDIKAYSYAMSQLGGSANGAKSAMEGLANFARYTPGAKTFLGQLGVTSADFGNTTKMMQDIAATFANMPEYLQKAYADRIGLGDPLQLQAMTRDTGEFEKQYKDFSERIAQTWGVNLDAMSDDSNEFMTNLRLMKAEFGLTFDVAVYKILENILPMLERLSAWMDGLSENKEFVQFSYLLGQIVDDVFSLISALNDLASNTSVDEFANGILISLSGVIETLSHLINMVNDIDNGNWSGAGKEAMAALGGANKAVFGLIDPSDTYTPFGISSKGWDDNNGGGSGNAVSGGWDDSNSNGGNSKFDQAAAAFKSAGMSTGGARGLAGALYGESKLDPGAIGDVVTRFGRARGIAQWVEPNRVNAVERHFHKSIGQMSYAEQLQAVIWEIGNNPRFSKLSKSLRSGTMDQSTAMRNVIGIFENPGSKGAMGDFHRGNAILGAHPMGSGVNMSQVTNINLHGAGDTHGTARAVANEQDTVNQRLVGNFQRFAL